VEMEHPLICFAHRGASGYEPENSMRSFRRAVELGAQWIECDVRAVEGRAVVFHDRAIKRMTGEAGLLGSQSLHRIKSLSLPQGEKIPFLSELLQEFKTLACLQIELKGVNSGVIVALELLQALEQGWSTQSLLVSSFDYDELKAFRHTAPSIPVGLLTYGYPLRCAELAREFGAYSVHLNIDSVSAKRVRELHDAGFKVFVYTVNDPYDINLMISLGVDGIFSDFPDRVCLSSPR
jgi:glycerophosphoryl diester phosphodiesterase